MPRYRQVELNIEVEVYKRLAALAQRHRGPKTDVRQYLVDALAAVVNSAEAELAKEDAKRSLILPVGRPPITVAPLVLT